MKRMRAEKPTAGVKMATVIEVPITVHRKVRDGWYVYTCDQLPGLYVASPDDRKAYDDLPTAIRTLVKLTYGTDCLVAHKVEYQDFEDMAGLTGRAAAAIAERTRELLTGNASDLSFVVQCVRSDDAHA
jgi:hypothetical protein